MSARKKKQPNPVESAPAPLLREEYAPRSTAAIMAQRVQIVLRLRLAGAQFADLLEFANGEAVEGRDGGPWGLTEAGLRYVITEANKLLAETARQSRGEMFEQHIARREFLYARAIDKGDERTALAILRDQAELCGLYENESIVELEKAVEELRKRLDHAGSSGNPAADQPR